MNLGNVNGHLGVRMKRDDRNKRFYAKLRFQGRDVYTRHYATADEAAMAREILEAALHLAVSSETAFPRS